MSHGSGRQARRAEHGEGSHETADNGCVAPSAPVISFRLRADVDREIANAGIRDRDLDKLIARQRAFLEVARRDLVALEARFLEAES
jgi:hypothetical protein